MPKQPAFPSLKHAMKTKETRRELFFSEMDAVVPWGRLLALVAPHYPMVIDAPSSTKNNVGASDPEMSSTKKGNDWYFGIKARIGVDAYNGVTHIDLYSS